MNTSEDYFNNLTRSVAASRKLLEKAFENKSLIEGTCLYVSIIDAFLRLAIIYNRVQKSDTHSYCIDSKLLFQKDGERNFLEKDIYKLSIEECVISKDLYSRLIDMYDFRNKVVHRFNISNLKYKEIGDVCSKFEVLYQEIFQILTVLEHGNNPISELGREEILEIKKFVENKTV